MTERHLTSITFEIGKVQKWYEIDYISCLHLSTSGHRLQNILKIMFSFLSSKKPI